MRLIASSQAVLEAGVPADLAEEIFSAAEKVLAVSPKSPRGDRVLVVVGNSPYAAATLAAAESLARAGHPVDVVGPAGGETRQLDDVPSCDGYRLIIESLGPSALTDAQAALFGQAQWGAHVVSVGTPAGIDPDTAADAGTRVVRSEDPNTPDEDYWFVRVPVYARADVTVAPRAMVSAHALHSASGQVIIVAGADGKRAEPDLLGQYERYAQGKNPLDTRLGAAAFLPDTVDPRASVAIADGAPVGRLRAKAALREGAGAVLIDADIPGSCAYGPARIHVRGDEISGQFGRVLLVDGLSRDQALHRGWEEKAVIVVPGERTLVVQPLLHAERDTDSGVPGVPPGIWTVHDAGVQWVDTPGGRDVLIGMMASSLARMEVSYETFLADHPRVAAEEERCGASPDDAVALYAVAAALAADGAPTTAGDIIRAIPDAWRECNRRLRA
ncbi:hypothetical protein [Corynebacterium sp. UBA2622]|uniref:hypothetical protein n=1 Tax=Corynebacterium sp. UBA2622 TaxID=1946393 RepID=UPI0025C5FE15|nr:hypothetical protein [Corynebacterium sp. UBA2622]